MVMSTQFSWKRLIRWRSRADAPADVALAGEARRVAVRYACDLETLCQSADGGESPRVSARVQNISRGGIKLLVDQPLETGTLLSVELPCVLVLACVVHVTAVSQGEWALGCTFSTELQDEDLQPFGVDPVPDRRAEARFACQIQATYCPVDSHEHPPRSAEVVDISNGGIGLVVAQPVDIGALLNVELRGPGEAEKLSMLACVVRVTAQENATWLLGCNFIRELTTPELQALL